jgi:hypothetical protein
MPSSKPKKTGFAKLSKAKRAETASFGGKATAKKRKAAAKKAAAAKPAKKPAKRK